MKRRHVLEAIFLSLTGSATFENKLAGVFKMF